MCLNPAAQLPRLASLRYMLPRLRYYLTTVRRDPRDPQVINISSAPMEKLVLQCEECSKARLVYHYRIYRGLQPLLSAEIAEWTALWASFVHPFELLFQCFGLIVAVCTQSLLTEQSNRGILIRQPVDQ